MSLAEVAFDVADTVGRASDGGDDEEKPPPSGGASSWIRLGLIVAAVVVVGVISGWPILAIIGALVVSIVLHEMGHYLVAKWTGMKVTEFFIGFGPRLWAFRRGETTYGLKLLPAGAYVRIIGMSNLERVDPADEPRSYRAQPYWKRLLVVLAGPFANFLVAFVLLVALFASFGQTRADSWEVGRVVEGSAAAEIGLQPGDRVIEVGGIPISSWASFRAAVGDVPGGPLGIAFERDGERHEVVADLGWRLDATAAAALPPLEEGDEIISVGGQPVTTYAGFADTLRSQAGGIVEVELRRQTGEVMPRFRTDLVVPTQLPEAGSTAFVGVGPADQRERLAPVEATTVAATTFGDVVAESVRGMVSFFSPSGLSRYVDQLTSSGDASAPVPEVPNTQLEPVDSESPAPVVATGSASSSGEDRVMSLIGVVRLGSQAAEAHPAALLWLVIVVNVFLGLFNLLPLPPLDGGHAAIATYEAIRGKVRGRPYRVDMARLMPVAYAVIFLLLGLGLTSMYLDIVSPVDSPFGG